MGVPLTTHTSTHTFLDANGAAADPDSETSIVFQVFDSLNREIQVESQTSATWDKASTGVFRYYYAPPVGLVDLDGFRVVAVATLGGKLYSAASELEAVEWPD